MNQNEIENIFAHAVSLEQSGKMKNTIYVYKDIVFILNFDRTVLIRFKIKMGQFPSKICFNANDYDSFDFRLENDKIIFKQQGKGNYDREKICHSPDLNFDEVKKLFNGFYCEDYENLPKIIFNVQDLELLEENLSHVEFLSHKLNPIILQRDIFSGTLIKLTKKSKQGFDLTDLKLKKDIFPPVGMRTNDLFSLMLFQNNIEIYFSNENYFYVTGRFGNMFAIISKCLYDNLGTIEILNEGEKNGRQIKENGFTKQEINRENQGQKGFKIHHKIRF